jgi:prepilin-type N-terminal cleavage/methylation domain-containing protein
VTPESRLAATSIRDDAPAAGFTLIEVVIVLAVIAILAGSMAPLIANSARRQRADAALREITTIAAALEAYYAEKARFPATLEEDGFVSSYVPVRATDPLEDPCGVSGSAFLYHVSGPPDVASVRSRGRNGVDNGGGDDDIVRLVSGAVPGRRRTRERLSVITAALASYLVAGGGDALLDGDWIGADRAALGLPPSFDRDGFGRPFVVGDDRRSVSSGGPDETPGTADDVLP